MSVWKTRSVDMLNWELVPTHWDQWLSTERTRRRALDRATTKRPLYIMPWNSHVVSEGIVNANDMDLQRALP